MPNWHIHQKSGKNINMKKILSLMLVLGLVCFGFSASSAQAAGNVKVKNAALKAQVLATTDVTNTPPTVNSISIQDAVTLSTTYITPATGATKNVIITAEIADPNGCSEETGVTVKFFQNSTSSAGAADNPNNHYSAAMNLDSCTGSNPTSTWSATIPVDYYANPSSGMPSSWVATVTPSDTEVGTPSSTNIFMNQSNGLSVNDTISYGALAAGAYTPNGQNQTTTVTNIGNTALAVTLTNYGITSSDGYAMVCTKDASPSGTIPATNEKFSIDSSANYSGVPLPMTSLAGNSSINSGLNIPKRTDGVSSAPVYWSLGLPATGVSGSCQGYVNFAAGYGI